MKIASFSLHHWFPQLLKTFMAGAVLWGTSPALGFVEYEDRKALDFEGERLTPFWAQEYIGADLVKEDMRKQNDLALVPFSIFDAGFEKKHINLKNDIEVDRAFSGSRPMRADHGTSVASLINGQGMMSVSEQIDFVQLRRVSPSIFYAAAVREIREMAIKPWVISNSMGWSSSEVLTLAQEVDSLGIIWVMAAGNDHPKKIVEHERVAPVISVGSYSPRGLQTLTSQESDQLDILAPADQYQASINGIGEHELFGETSGATPLVSGTIANLKSLIPGLSRYQVEHILKKTAFRSFHSLYSKENKTGLLNSYKAYKVVERLKERCGNNASCVDQEVHKNDVYEFKYSLSPKFKALCENKEILSETEMKALRRVHFLGQSAEVARLLGCAYRNEEYNINADYYFNLVLIQTNPKSLQEKIQKLASEAVLKGYRESAALRDLEILDGRFESSLRKVLSENAESGIGKYRAGLLLEAFNSVTRVRVPGLSLKSNTRK